MPHSPSHFMSQDCEIISPALLQEAVKNNQVTNVFIKGKHTQVYRE